MVKITRYQIPSKKQREPDPPTTLGMRQVLVGNMITLGRPFEFDKDVSDPTAKLTKLSTSCPKCGYGITINFYGGDRIPEGSCDNCGLGVAKPLDEFNDPFRNPFEDGILTFDDINTNNTKAVTKSIKRDKATSKSTVAPIKLDDVEHAPIDHNIVDVLNDNSSNELSDADD